MTKLQSTLNDLFNEIAELDGPVRYRRKLNKAAVLQARLMYAVGFTKAEIAREVGCTPENIHFVVTRKTWKHV